MAWLDDMLLPTSALNERSLVAELKEYEKQIFYHMVHNHRLSPPLGAAEARLHTDDRFHMLQSNIETCIKIARLQRSEALQKINEELAVAQTLVSMSNL